MREMCGTATFPALQAPDVWHCHVSRARGRPCYNGTNTAKRREQHGNRPRRRQQARLWVHALYRTRRRQDRHRVHGRHDRPLPRGRRKLLRHRLGVPEQRGRAARGPCQTPSARFVLHRRQVRRVDTLQQRRRPREAADRIAREPRRGLHRPLSHAQPGRKPHCRIREVRRLGVREEREGARSGPPHRLFSALHTRRARRSSSPPTPRRRSYSCR